MTLWFHSVAKAMTLDLGGTDDTTTATRLSGEALGESPRARPRPQSPRGRRGGYGSA